MSHDYRKTFKDVLSKFGDVEITEEDLNMVRKLQFANSQL